MSARGGRSYKRNGSEPGPPTSSASSIDAWFARARSKPNLHFVLLAYEGLSGMEEVEQWQLPELVDGAGETVFAAAQCHAEDLGAVGRYSVRLLGPESEPLGSKLIRVVPTDAAGELPLGATEVEDASSAGVVAQSLRHNEALARMYVGSMGGVLGRMHDLLKMEQNENDRLRQRLREADRRARSDDDGPTPEEAEAAAERSAALAKLMDTVTEHVLPAVMRRYGGGNQHDA